MAEIDQPPSISSLFACSQNWMGIVREHEHSDGAPTVEGTGIRIEDIAVAYEHSGCDPDEITQLYPDLSLGDVHRALAYDYGHD